MINNIENFFEQIQKTILSNLKSNKCNVQQISKKQMTNTNDVETKYIVRRKFIICINHKVARTTNFAIINFQKIASMQRISHETKNRFLTKRLDLYVIIRFFSKCANVKTKNFVVFFQNVQMRS